MKTFYIWCCCTILLLDAKSVSGQPSFQSSDQDSTRILTLVDSISSVAYKDINHANRMVQRLSSLISKQKDTVLVAKTYGVMGAILSVHQEDSIKLASIPFIEKSLFYFRALGDSSGVQKNLTNLAALYGNLQNYQKMLDLSLNALKLAKYLNNKNEEGKEKLGLAYANLAFCFNKLNWLDSAVANYQRAQKYLKQTDHPAQYRIADHFAKIYIHQKDYERAYILLQEAYEACETKGLSELSAEIAMELGYLFYVTSEYRRALKYLKVSLLRPASATVSRIYLAQCFAEINEIDSAAHYLTPLEAAKVPLQYRNHYYLAQADIAKAQKNNNASLHYRYQTKLVEDSLEVVQNISQTARLLLMDQVRQQTEQLSEYEQLLSKKNLAILFTAMIALFTVSGGIWIYRKYLSSSTAIRQEQTEKEHLKRKLVSKTAKLALQSDLLHKNQVLLDKIKKYVDLKGLLDPVDEMQSRLKEQLEIDKIWENFFAQFEEIHPNFLSYLKDTYNLTPNDLKLCAFIKMNLSLKEIAPLMRVGHNSLHVHMNRMKKKLKLAPEVSAYEYIQSFSENQQTTSHS